MDFLLRGGRDRAAPFQHHPNPEEHLLLPQVDVRSALWKNQQDQEGTSQNGKLFIILST